jgi:uncharacterized protein YqfA (UPF0365 family)
VLENPDTISKRVLAQGHGAGTALEIHSIDIADIDVGANVAETTRPIRPKRQRRFQARRKSAGLRPNPGAGDLACSGKPGQVVLAEAEIPWPSRKPSARQAGRDGLLPMTNIQADTQMRNP